MRLRKVHSEANDARADKRRRDGRGWGPFSGGQLTIIVVTLAVVTLIPVGAWAVVNSNVAITDPGGVNRAAVNVNGQLSVTGPALPSSNTNYVKWSAFNTTFGCSDLLTVPAGKVLMITSIVIDASAVAGSPVRIDAAATAAACGAPANFAGSVEIPSVATSTMSFPSGFPVRAGRHLILQEEVNDASGYAWVYGYLLPSSLCTVIGSNGVAGCN